MHVTAATVPYFFLSYAHKSRGDAQDEDEPDYWIGEFFRDLCRSVAQQAGLPEGANPGFMDRDRRVGDDWPSGVVQALSACRVFVPLYSARYFADECCGQEWSYIARRAMCSAAQRTMTVPAIWDPVAPENLPQAARTLRSRYHGSRAYETFGLYGIMKPSRYRNDYAQAVDDLAGRIVAAAEPCPVKEGPNVDYRTLDNAFGHAEGSEGRSGDKWVRITIVAPRRGELPCERGTASYYGPTALNWNPYAPRSRRPIADYAAELVRSLGFRAEIGDLYQHEQDLLAGDPRSGPQILIIDPWALLVPFSQRLLARLNACPMPWVQAIIPWNAVDNESQEWGDKLRAELDDTFGDKLAAISSTSVMAVRGVPSLGDFGMVLNQLITVASRGYLGNAAAYPPSGESVERPRIS